MEETLKSRLIVILGIVTLIFFITTVGSCKKANRQYSKFQQEMSKRLDAEEKANIFTREKEAYEKKIAALTEELAKGKKALEATGKELLQEQLVTESLQDELLKVKKLNAKLEQDLEAAVAENKVLQPKK